MTTTLTFDVHSPATGALVGSYPSHDESAVEAAVDRAHGAATWWRRSGFRRARPAPGSLANRDHPRP